MSISPIELRHSLHKNPELAFKEFETTKLITDSVKSLDKSGVLKIHTPFPTGLIVEYRVNESEYLLFRADIDALPIKEENEIDFRSQNDCMHACGHDVHTSILYSFISEILDRKPDQNLLFLFQPAEEGGGGAIKFYETGIFNQFKIKSAFALHVTDEYPFGTIASTSGVLFASALEIDIEFIGESAHVAFPMEGKNAFNALRKFMDEADVLQSEHSKAILLGLGKFSAGNVRNIAPGSAKIEGSIRGLSAELVNDFKLKVEKILDKVKNETGVDYKIIDGAHYPEVIVDEKLYNLLSKHLSKDYNFIDCGPKMTGEDFGFLSKKWSSFMCWLGTSKGERYGLHNPKFLPPDDVIESGKNVLLSVLNVV